MNDFILVASWDSIDDLLQKRNCFIFGNLLLFSKFIKQTALVTKFNNHKFVIFAFKTFVAFQNIIWIDLHHYYWLLFQIPPCFSFYIEIRLLLYDSFVNNFHSNLLISQFVLSSINFSVCTTSDFLKDAIFVDLHSAFDKLEGKLKLSVSGLYLPLTYWYCLIHH